MGGGLGRGNLTPNYHSSFGKTSEKDKEKEKDIETAKERSPRPSETRGGSVPRTRGNSVEGRKGNSPVPSDRRGGSSSGLRGEGFREGIVKEGARGEGVGIEEKRASRRIHAAGKDTGKGKEKEKEFLSPLDPRSDPRSDPNERRDSTDYLRSLRVNQLLQDLPVMAVGDLKRLMLVR